MTIENRMVIGDYYNDETEITQDEMNSEFREWFENPENFNETEMWECFLESWHTLELIGFIKSGKSVNEFIKYASESLKESFESETGFEVEIDYVIEQVKDEI